MGRKGDVGRDFCVSGIVNRPVHHPPLVGNGDARNTPPGSRNTSGPILKKRGIA